jgi:hypothetical protein
LTINPWRCLNLPAHAQERSGRVFDCRMADDPAMMLIGESRPRSGSQIANINLRDVLRKFVQSYLRACCELGSD